MNKKIDLTLLKSLITELEASVDSIEVLNVETLSKEDGTAQHFVTEVAKAYGSATALSIEASGLALDAMELLKVHGLKTAPPNPMSTLGKAASAVDATKALEELFGLSPTGKPKPGGSFN